MQIYWPEQKQFHMFIISIGNCLIISQKYQAFPLSYFAQKQV